jgi:hypothetical protein
MKKSIIEHTKTIKVAVTLLFFAAMAFNVAMTTTASSGSAAGRLNLRGLAAMAMGSGEGTLACATDMDCPCGYYCEGGYQCRPGRSCSFNFECPFNEPCVNGLCARYTGNCFE